MVLKAVYLHILDAEVYKCCLGFSLELHYQCSFVSFHNLSRECTLDPV